MSTLQSHCSHTLRPYHSRPALQSPYDYGGKSATFNTYGISYSHVCGRMVGYQFSVPNTFCTGSRSIDSYYVDGVSLIHGPPGARQHIWTFAAGYSEDNYLGCPCTNRLNAVAAIPSFVGNDFFCESGTPGNMLSDNGYFPDDPLWVPSLL